MKNVLPITEYDFEKLNKHLANQSASFSMGENGDGLIYDPEENLIKIKKLWKKYDFVCTHMKEERKGPSCEGSIVECNFVCLQFDAVCFLFTELVYLGNDRGQCINGHCYCLPGYGGDHCYLNGILNCVILLVPFISNTFETSKYLKKFQSQRRYLQKIQEEMGKVTAKTMMIFVYPDWNATKIGAPSPKAMLNPQTVAWDHVTKLNIHVW